jgi:hypothetical protein
MTPEAITLIAVVAFAAGMLAHHFIMLGGGDRDHG